jgi:hypothetical protein
MVLGLRRPQKKDDNDRLWVCSRKSMQREKPRASARGTLAFSRKGWKSIMESDEWGIDPAVQTMRKVFRQMELAQRELLKEAGIAMWDPRLRRWREISLAAFERAWANAARRGVDLREDQVGALYAHCLARTMTRDGIEPCDNRQCDETIKRLVEEVFF